MTPVASSRRASKPAKSSSPLIPCPGAPSCPPSLSLPQSAWANWICPIALSWHRSPACALGRSITCRLRRRPSDARSRRSSRGRCVCVERRRASSQLCRWSHDLEGYLTMKLKSNTILITGGASGIGYELTKQLTALGNKILITGRDQAKMDRAKASFPKINTYQSDVSDPEAIATIYEEVTKQFPELNILINNAGIMRKINVHDKAGSLEDITREIEINLSGPIRMVKQFLPHLKTKSEAAIMNVSSSLAFVPLPISPFYCATKAGMHSFTESLRVQLKNTKVKVFELAPPATQTELLGDFDVEDMKGASIMKVA